MTDSEPLRRIRELQARLALEQLAHDFRSPFAEPAAMEPDPGDPSTPDAEVVHLAQTGRHRAAVALQRELTGMGRAEAKTFVDGLR